LFCAFKGSTWRREIALIIVFACYSARCHGEYWYHCNTKKSKAKVGTIASRVPLCVKSYAMVISIDQYSGGGPRLSKAVSYAREVAIALED
jgi:hypothetical protein